MTLEEFAIQLERLISQAREGGLSDEAIIAGLDRCSTSSLSSFTADGAYDQDGVYTAVAERHLEAAVIVPPRGVGA